MANAFYPKGKEALCEGQIDWTSDTIKIVLLSASYTYSSAHDFFDDIAGGAVLSTATLSGKTDTNGLLDADDPTFPLVSGPDPGTQLVIYKDTGTSSTSRLILYFDTGVDLPVTLNGGNIPVNFDAAGIAQL